MLSSRVSADWRRIWGTRGFTGDGRAGGKRPFSAGRCRLSPRRRWGQDVPQGTLYAPAQNRQNRPPSGLQGPRSSRAGWSVRSWPAASATPAAPGWWASAFVQRWSRDDLRPAAATGLGPAEVGRLAAGAHRRQAAPPQAGRRRQQPHIHPQRAERRIPHGEGGGVGSREVQD